MQSLSKAKKSLLWICIGFGLCLLILLPSSTPAGTYKYAIKAKDKVVGLLNFTNVNIGLPPYLPDSLTISPCELDAACRMKELRERIRHVCDVDKKVKRTSDRKKTFSGFLNHEHRLLYFSIPKVGCSFWKRIFKVLNDERYGANIFDIPNYKAHFGPGLLKITTRKEVEKYINNYTSYLFVRDPFSRLFSGYIDKMFVPNPIAYNHGRNIFTMYRSTTQHRCELDISFERFAMYVADSIVSNRIGDPHFVPMWKHLNPCDINLTYVGKMEHFMEDTNYILSSNGVSLDDLSGSTKSENFDELHEKGYMKDIINRTFKFLKSKKVCLTPRSILQRIWTSFHIRGYISKSQSMPKFKNPQKITNEDMINATFKAYDLSGPKSERSLQRKEAMMEAYTRVPASILQKLANAFDMDCRIFEYNCNVKERFLVRKPSTKFYFKN